MQISLPNLSVDRTPAVFMRLAVVLVSTLAIVQCGGGGGSSTPTSPTTPAASTRIIGITGNLAFGSVNVGSSRAATFTISNTGNSTLTVSSIGASSGFVSQ